MILTRVLRGLAFLKSRIFMISWISLIAYMFCETFNCYKYERRFYHLRQILGIGLCIARGSATVVNVCCALILLPLCRKLNQLLYRLLARCWPGLFFFWLEVAKSFHMTVAITLFIFSVMHSISHLVNLWNFSRKYDELHPDINLVTSKGDSPWKLLLTRPCLTGLAMLMITTTMSLASSRIVRRTCYNVFWYTHQMYLPFMMLLLIHPLSGVLKEEILNETVPNNDPSQISDNFNDAPKFISMKSTTWLWIVLPLSLYLIDLMWRIISRNKSDVEIIKMSAMDGRVLSLTLSCPHESFSCRPGQYVLLQCPDISLLEWHPFTVVKVPTATERNFAVWIKVVGDWTEALENLLIARNKKIRLLVDGPMASPLERARRTRLAVCVCAGVGVTPFVPLLYDLLSEPRRNTPRRVHLIWIVRSESEAMALGDLATTCLQVLRESNRPDRLHIAIHITGSSSKGKVIDTAQTIVNEKGVTYVDKRRNEVEIPLLDKNSEFNLDVGKDMAANKTFAKEYPLLACRLKKGRPYWDQEFGCWVHLYPKDHLTMFCCGPKNLVDTLRVKCKQISLSTKTTITFIHERFS